MLQLAYKPTYCHLSTVACYFVFHEAKPTSLAFSVPSKCELGGSSLETTQSYIIEQRLGSKARSRSGSL